MHDMVLVLNEHRQIVALNEAVLKTLNATLGDLAAKRPGEAVGCVWASEGPDGCGTGPHCITCGAIAAILESQQQNVQVVKECRIRTQWPVGTWRA